jgi:hypothetical protein
MKRLLLSVAIVLGSTTIASAQHTFGIWALDLNHDLSVAMRRICQFVDEDFVRHGLFRWFEFVALAGLQELTSFTTKCGYRNMMAAFLDAIGEPKEGLLSRWPLGPLTEPFVGIAEVGNKTTLHRAAAL